MLQYQQNPNGFAVSLMDAPGREPLACAATCLTACCGLPACYYRKRALESLGRGVDDYVCCQGYIPGCCGVEPSTMCQGQLAGLLCEVRARGLGRHAGTQPLLGLTPPRPPSTLLDRRAAAARRSPSRSRASS